MRSVMVILVGFLLALSLPAQDSASYHLNEHTFNAGGDPTDGIVLASASYRVTLDAIGDGLVAPGLGSVSYHMEASFVSSCSPPGEVHELLFSDAETLIWSPEKSVGDYNLYRDLVSNVIGLGYGVCEQQDIVAPTTIDSDLPPGSDGYFYLVTAENRLDEEGTKGTDSGDAERHGNVCP